MQIRSLWQETAPTSPALPWLEGAVAADVAIVGAGFTGLSTALHLAERGASVIVLDAEEPGWGASGRNGGQVIPGLKYDPRELIAHFGAERGKALSDFAGRTAETLFDLVTRYAIPCDAVRNGWIQGATDRVGLARVRARTDDWQAQGADVAFIGADEASARVGTNRYFGAFFDRRGGHVQPLSLARGMATAALDKGVRVFGRSAVRKLERSGADWVLAGEHGSVRAGQIVLGTAGYTGDLWPGLKRSIVATTSLQVATSRLPADLAPAVLPGDQSVSETRNHLAYYRRHGPGRLVFGGSGAFRDPVPGDFDALVRAARRHFPQLRDVKFEFAWWGRFANTTDHLPHLHVLAPGLFTWLGCNGRGVALSTAMGPVLAELVDGARPEDLPVPVTSARPIPLHGLQPIYVSAFSRFYAWQDAFRRAVS